MRFTQVLVALVVVHANLAVAQPVPTTVTFTARVVDNGTPVQGSKNFLFKLFPTVSGGTESWMETQTLTVVDGNVSAELGASMALSDSIFSGGKLFLEVTVDGTILTPRTPVASVPYAIRTSVAAKVGTLAEVDIQKRVSAAGCPAGSSIRLIDAMGNVTCQTANVTVITDGGTAGITGVFGMGGITGGGTAGDINLSVNFAGSGSAVTASRSDHGHTGTYLPLGATLACMGTDKMTGINPATGVVTCAPDNNAGGSVTSVAAGTGLTGGTITSSGTIGLASTVQNWSSQPSCGVGSYIRAITAAGVPTCDVAAAGTVTSVATGAGLTGGPISSNGTISIPTNGVSNAMLANSGVTVTVGGGLTGGGNVQLGQSVAIGTAAAGDLSGTLGAATVTGLKGIPLGATAPTFGQVPTFNSGAYVATSPTFGAAGNARGAASSNITIPLNTVVTLASLSIPTLPPLSATAAARVSAQGSIQIKVNGTQDCSLAIQVRSSNTGPSNSDPGYTYFWIPANLPTQFSGGHYFTLPFSSTGMLPVSNTYFLQVFALPSCQQIIFDWPSITVDFVNQVAASTLTPL